MSDPGLKRYQMLLLTGNDKDNGYGLDEKAMIFLTSSVPLLKEVEENQRKRNKKKKDDENSDNSFERNADDVKSISNVSEIDENQVKIEENQLKKEESPKIQSNIFQKYKQIDEEDFETPQNPQKTVIIPLKIEKDIDLIDEKAGISQFLTILNGKNDSPDAIYKLSDLYYPESRDNYNDLKQFIDRENIKNRFDLLTNSSNLNEKRKILESFFQEISKMLKKQEKPIEKQEKTIEKPLISEENNEKITLICEESKKTRLFNLPKPEKSCFNKISSQSFFSSLKNTLRCSIFDNCEENDTFKQKEPSKYENDFFLEGKASVFSFKSSKIKENNDFEENMEKNNDEEEILLDFRRNMKKFSDLWGEIREFSQEKGLETQFDSLFALENDKKPQNNEKKPLYLQNSNYFNPEILNLSNFLKSNEKPVISIDLANHSIFLKEIHGKYFIKPKVIKEKHEEFPDNHEDNNLEAASSTSFSSKNSKKTTFF